MKIYNPTTEATSEGADRVRTAKGFTVPAFLSFVLSVSLWFSGDRETGLFVGIWVPSILSAGTLMLSRGMMAETTLFGMGLGVSFIFSPGLIST